MRNETEPRAFTRVTLGFPVSVGVIRIPEFLRHLIRQGFEIEPIGDHVEDVAQDYGGGNNDGVGIQ